MDGKQMASALPGMLPRDAGISGAQDATEALIRAVSRLWAIQASRFAGEQDGVVLSVEEFRADALDGRLLAADQVDAWIHEQEKRDGVPSWWLAGVALNEGDYERDEDGSIRITKAIPVDWRSDGNPGKGWERPGVSERKVVYITPHGVAPGRTVRDGATLDELRRLSLVLADEYAWEPEQATVFLLTGLTPYNAAWARQIETMRVHGRRPRDISIKHLELACFSAEHDEQPPATRMALWNALHPEWSYATITNFGRDSRQAVTRLSERMGERMGRRKDGDSTEESSRPDLEELLYAFEHEFGAGKPNRALSEEEVRRIAEEGRAEGKLPPRTQKRSTRRSTPLDLERAVDSASDELARQLIAVMRRLSATKDETEIQQGMAEGMRLAEAIKRLLHPEGVEAKA